MTWARELLEPILNLISAHLARWKKRQRKPCHLKGPRTQRTTSKCDRCRSSERRSSSTVPCSRLRRRCKMLLSRFLRWYKKPRSCRTTSKDKSSCQQIKGDKDIRVLHINKGMLLWWWTQLTMMWCSVLYLTTLIFVAGALGLLVWNLLKG